MGGEPQRVGPNDLPGQTATFVANSVCPDCGKPMRIRPEWAARGVRVKCRACERKEGAAATAEQRKNRLPYLLIEAGVPMGFLAARLADFNEAARAVRPNEYGLYLQGKTGRGKSHLAAAWLAELAPACNTMFWLSCPWFLAELRSSFGKRAGPTEERIIKRYAATDLLVFDDLGAEQATDWARQSIYLLLSERNAQVRQTIVTSNLTLGDIHGADPRLASRLGAMARYEVVGQDRRIRE